ncbi:hypothetical protein [Vreelandella venusta]|jgi:hypothetical protein|uniref:hypothetical protein n=1 Tax=Vreelandella venusta TaxID=44935 RepID=UPI003C30249D
MSLINDKYVEWKDLLLPISQNNLHDEGQFIRFLKGRGLPVFGVVTGDPSLFVEKGWLEPDNYMSDNIMFHPFRLYSVYRLLEMCKLRIAPTSSVNRGNFRAFLNKVSDHVLSISEISDSSKVLKEIVDLAIILEPVYWPVVTNRERYSFYMSQENYDALIEQHRSRVKDLILNLDIDKWKEVHARLRRDAASLDDNGDVYLLLRLAPWQKRERLKGQLSAALWVRHIAEVIRLGFEETCNVKWPEEDEAYGQWFSGAREYIYGSSRPLDNELYTRPHVAFEFGLHTGSTIRWYLEGETEYYAALTALPKASAGGVELVNLKGAVGNERANAALRLADGIEKDRDVRRFSFISFDVDVPANVRAIKRRVKEGSIVGFVNANDPDFEFGNFTLHELIEIAASLDDSEGLDGDRIRLGEWAGVSSGREFEERYKVFSLRKASGLKGEQWGSALGLYMIENPCFPESEKLRPFFETINAVVRARTVKYEYQRDNSTIDPLTFKLITHKNNL